MGNNDRLRFRENIPRAWKSGRQHWLRAPGSGEGGRSSGGPPLNIVACFGCHRRLTCPYWPVGRGGAAGRWRRTLILCSSCLNVGCYYCVYLSPVLSISLCSSSSSYHSTSSPTFSPLTSRFIGTITLLCARLSLNSLVSSPISLLINPLLYLSTPDSSPGRINPRLTLSHPQNNFSIYPVQYP